MNGCFTMGNAGGGGTYWKLRAVRADSYGLLPENVRDGTIGIISSVMAGNVWVMNTEPMNAKEGDVWMMTAEDSNAPISSKYVTLYPRRFLQYISGAWVPVEGYVRYQGQWVGPVLWLYSQGNQYAGATGGWVSAVQGGSFQHDVTYREKRTMRLYAHTGATGGLTFAAVSTANKLPAGLYNKLFVTLWRDDDNGNVIIGFDDDTDTSAPTVVPFTVVDRSNSEYQTLEVDLTSIPTEYMGHLKIRAQSPLNNQAEIVYISDVWMTN